MIRAGVCVIDITPPVGLVMSGFGARTGCATGTHDALTVRTLAVNDTALVVADVLGLHEDMSQRIRMRCCLPPGNIVLAALHTHGGPAAMVNRAGGGTDAAFLQRLEDACVVAIDRAVAQAVPARLSAGYGADPDVARNRRHADGLLDRALPVLRIDTADGLPLAVVTSYACHPVVLGADNRLWTADYPHFVRARLETVCPGAVALFATGCAGDANTGHTAAASISLAANPDRTFTAAQAIGDRIANAALQAIFQPCGNAVTAAEHKIMLDFARREQASPSSLALQWRAEKLNADPARAIMLEHWIRWAEGVANADQAPWRARVSALNWGGVKIVALPGEIFAETALAIRAALGVGPAFVLGFAEGNPGYIPPESAYEYGGYEVDEAHRYYGMPATFAPGCAGRLAQRAIALATG